MDPYKHLFENNNEEVFSVYYLPTINKEVVKNIIVEISELSSKDGMDSFETSKVGLYLVSTLINMLKIDDKADSMFKSFTESKWKIAFMVLVCNFITYDSTTNLTYEEKLQSIQTILFTKYNYLIKEDQELFNNLLNSSRELMFSKHLDDIKKCGLELYKATVINKVEFTLTDNFILLLICLFGKWCWCCCYKGISICERLVNKKYNNFNELDRLNILSYIQNYSSSLLEELVVIYSQFDRFMYEHSLYIDPLFMQED